MPNVRRAAPADRWAVAAPTLIALTAALASIAAERAERRPPSDPGAPAVRAADPAGPAPAITAILEPDRPIDLPPSPQRPGDPEAGRRYLLHGDYVGAGYPYDVFLALFARDVLGGSLIARDGPAARIPHDHNVFTAHNGVTVVGGLNCLGCHAQVFRGELVVGLGNSLADWTFEHAGSLDALDRLVAFRHGRRSPAWAIHEQFVRGARAVLPHVRVPTRGLNPAFRLEEAAAAHRDPADLTWLETPLYDIGPDVIASDPPPLWNLKKKSALYATGLGRGDFAKLISQISIVAIRDAEALAAIQPSMQDLMAYLRTLEPPAYPGPIDVELARRGQAIFETTCSRCHGTYVPARPEIAVALGRSGAIETYPTKLVPLDHVGTDPLYARRLAASGLPEWLNRSWYAHSEPPAWNVPAHGYVAPPLDGVWCTAPYLHNGSVPDLASLLDSSDRPDVWARSFEDDDYDLERVGWRHDPDPEVVDEDVYDTRRAGHGNGGHTFGDDLTDDERAALIEYLKTI